MVCEDRRLTAALPEQARAASHRGSHARLLAGPGTGKTWTLIEHVAGLLADGVPAHQILCLTFTRAAAAGFRRKLTARLGPGAELPETYTLHAFALRRLMQRNADLGAGRGRARVADDWEEKEVVRDDLAHILGVGLREIDRRLAALAAEWETAPGVPPAVDPQLLGALQASKARYRYVLRAELVFELHAAMNGDPALLRDAYQHVIVDEYQDLNRCDVAVIDEIAARGATVFVAGDDDQSIYQQLRHAHPQAIRDFVANHAPAGDLVLETCVRCDQEIIEIANEVISGEPGRVPKVLRPYPTSGPGLVEILSFPDQHHEAAGIATLARKYVDAGVDLDQIMVLLRSDHQGRFSAVIEAALSRAGVASIVRTAPETALGSQEGRTLLAHLRLRLDDSDDLAWRTILECERNGIGRVTIDALHANADAEGRTFGASVSAVATNPGTIARGNLVADQHRSVHQRLAHISAAAPADLEALVDTMAGVRPASPELEAARAELGALARTYLSTDLAEFLTSIALRKEEEEAIVANTVNIMTMHKAKGLDACVVFVAAAEHEVLVRDPAATNEARRLFYVSLSRAKRALFITHATRRTGLQAHSAAGGAVLQRARFLQTRGASRPGTAFANAFVVDPLLLQPEQPPTT